MSKSLRVLALIKDSSFEINVNGLTPIGGKKSTGVVLEGLKASGDYAVIARVGNSISVHPLRGSKAKPVSLQTGQVISIEDLAIFVDQPKAYEFGTESSEIEKLSSILLNGASQQSTQKTMEDILSALTILCGHQQGLIVSQALDGEYQVLAARNLDASRAWLSEKLVQKALATKEPVILENVFGSDFDSSQSLVATQFVSVFCWPLVVQGVTVGALVSGSRIPGVGRFEQVRAKSQVYVNLAAMFLDFHLRELRLEKQLGAFRSQNTDSPFLTQNAELIEVCELARKVASSDLAVLVQGETGVGKEVLSRWIHERSDRKNGAFVAVNCAAIPTELLESALFGHKRGSFTGALNDHIGKIQQAHGGTLFLDEIGDLPLSLQSKLLRVLQDQSVEPVGSNKPVQVNVRVICATHKDVRKMVDSGQFRQDLYYRLAQVTLSVAPLRERTGDIRLLAQQFLRQDGTSKRLSQDAWSWLFAQPWPGNIRELKTAIKRAVVICTGNELHEKHFIAGSGQDLEQRKSTETLESAKYNFVMQRIEQALHVTSGNRTRAAEVLGITPRTLFRYLEQKDATESS